MAKNKLRKGSFNYRSGRESGHTHDLAFQDVTQGDPTFREFVREAYDARDGYAIRRNPITGETEMFVAGTHGFSARGWLDHFSNVIDGLNRVVEDEAEHIWVDELGLPAFLMPRDTIWRRNAIRKFNKAARDNHVDVVYGHSRGGSLVADMTVSEDTAKVGLSSATILARNKDIWNLTSTDMFSKDFLALTGTNNVVYDPGFDTNWHQTWKKMNSEEVETNHNFT